MKGDDVLLYLGSMHPGSEQRLPVQCKFREGWLHAE